jgi:hypothetical protein
LGRTEEVHPMTRRKAVTGKLVKAANVTIKVIRVLLTPATFSLLRIDADKQKKTVAAFVRALIDDHLAERKVTEKQQAATALVSQVWEAVRAQPFRPFTIKLVDGRNHTVNDPDRVRIIPSGREHLFVAGAEGIHQIDPLLIADVATGESESPDRQPDNLDGT